MNDVTDDRTDNRRSEMRSRRWLTIASVVVLLGPVTAACSSSPSLSSSSTTPSTPSDEVTAIGATEASWNAQHVERSGRDCPGEPCYGNIVRTPQGERWQFSKVGKENGRITAFTLSMPTNTSEAEAKQKVLALVPSDAGFGGSGTLGTPPYTCFVYDLVSAKVGVALGEDGDRSGAVGVVFSTLGPSGPVLYNPANVNEAVFTNGQTDFGGTCTHHDIPIPQER